MHNNVKAYFFYSGLTLILFCVANKLTERKIMHKDGYNLLQAYLFYEKCKKKGINVSASKLTKKDKALLVELAEPYDYCNGFSENQIVELYNQGREVILTNQKYNKKG